MWAQLVSVRSQRPVVADVNESELVIRLRLPLSEASLVLDRRPARLPVQRPHDADARQHRQATGLRDKDRCSHCRLPFGHPMSSDDNCMM